jgi:hypothetical protein
MFVCRILDGTMEGIMIMNVEWKGPLLNLQIIVLILPWSYIKWPFSLPMFSFFLWPYELKNLCLRQVFVV